MMDADKINEVIKSLDEKLEYLSTQDKSHLLFRIFVNFATKETARRLLKQILTIKNLKLFFTDSFHILHFESKCTTFKGSMLKSSIFWRQDHGMKSLTWLTRKSLNRFRFVSYLSYLFTIINLNLQNCYIPKLQNRVKTLRTRDTAIPGNTSELW